MHIYEISHEMSNHEQISKLRRLIKNPPKDGRSVLIEFTPELSKHVLADGSLKGRNRSKRANKIDKFADAMKSGKWSLTGDTIKFADRLLDGQHRLTACFRAGVPFKSHAVFGVPANHFARLDQGTTRSAADIFNLAGVKYYAIAAATTRWIKILTEGKDRGTTYTPEALLKFYEKELRGGLFDACLSEAIKAKKISQCPPATLVAICYMAAKRGSKQNEVLRFITQMGDLNAPPRSPAVVCRDCLGKLKRDRAGRLHEDIRNQVVRQCLDAHLRNKPISKSKILDQYP